MSELNTGSSIEDLQKILFQQEKCICQILQNDAKIGIGFLCKIPFPNKNKNLLPVLITNYQVLNENYINNNNNNIDISINDDKVKIKIDNSRKKYMNPDKSVELTIIEIKPNKDKICNFIEFDENEIYKNNSGKKVYIFHLDKGEEINASYGINYDEIENSNVKNGSLILSYETFKIIGIYCANSKDYNKKYDSFMNYLINDFNNKKYRNEINLIYKTDKEGEENIFGEIFVKNNQNNIDNILINGIKSKFVYRYKLKEGENIIKIFIKKNITQIEYMFSDCKCLKNITELKYLDTKDINNFSYIFSGCSSLSDIKPIQNWNVSKGNDFSYMFSGCSSLSDIKPLQYWNVSKGDDFNNMFSGCSSLSNIKPLQYWNASNEKNFDSIFSGCTLISDDDKTFKHLKFLKGKSTK